MAEDLKLRSGSLVFEALIKANAQPNKSNVGLEYWALDEAAIDAFVALIVAGASTSTELSRSREEADRHLRSLSLLRRCIEDALSILECSNTWSAHMRARTVLKAGLQLWR